MARESTGSPAARGRGRSSSRRGTRGHEVPHRSMRPGSCTPPSPHGTRRMPHPASLPFPRTRRRCAGTRGTSSPPLSRCGSSARPSRGSPRCRAGLSASNRPRRRHRPSPRPPPSWSRRRRGDACRGRTPRRASIPPPPELPAHRRDRSVRPRPCRPPEARRVPTCRNPSSPCRSQPPGAPSARP